jgi:hypothetical protein
MLQEAYTKQKTASNVHRQCTSKGSLYHHLTVPHINSNNFAMTFMTFDCGDLRLQDMQVRPEATSAMTTNGNQVHH